MRWSKDAEEAVARAPFFVRRRVKKRVEEEAEGSGATIVTMDHVVSCRQRFVNNMEKEVRGYQVETCFGASGCPNRAVECDNLAVEIENLPELSGVLSFLKKKVKGPLKIHHEFRISISDCPNACSRPQIADIGLIGALKPVISPNLCNECGVCKVTCKENAIDYADEDTGISINWDKCVYCGQCVKVCPAGALKQDLKGYRVALGGKLGRRPQLAVELKGIRSQEQAVEIAKKSITHYTDNSERGERFGELLNQTGLDFIDPPQNDSDEKE